MRTIKFRAWDGEKMILLHLDDWTFYNGELCRRNAPKYPIMEYTGLKDKNGKEIYEEDIIEYDTGTKARVIFKNGCFCGYDGYATSSDEAYTNLSPEENPYDGFDFEIEVIGNIHQNPDLL